MNMAACLNAGNDLNFLAIASLAPALAMMTQMTSLDLECTCAFATLDHGVWLSVQRVAFCELLVEAR